MQEFLEIELLPIMYVVEGSHVITLKFRKKCSNVCAGAIYRYG
jgi:hypothetical protein